MRENTVRIKWESRCEKLARTAVQFVIGFNISRFIEETSKQRRWAASDAEGCTRYNLRVSFLRSSVTVVYTDIITPNATVVHTTAEDKVGGNTRPAHPHLRLLCMYLLYPCSACSSVYTLRTLTADYIAEPSNRR